MKIGAVEFFDECGVERGGEVQSLKGIPSDHRSYVRKYMRTKGVDVRIDLAYYTHDVFVGTMCCVLNKHSVGLVCVLSQMTRNRFERAAETEMPTCLNSQNFGVRVLQFGRFFWGDTSIKLQFVIVRNSLDFLRALSLLW